LSPSPSIEQVIWVIAKPSRASSKTFDPLVLAQREFVKGLKVTAADALPPGGAGHGERGTPWHAVGLRVRWPDACDDQEPRCDVSYGGVLVSEGRQHRCEPGCTRRPLGDSSRHVQHGSRHRRESRKVEAVTSPTFADTNFRELTPPRLDRIAQRVGTHAPGHVTLVAPYGDFVALIGRGTGDRKSRVTNDWSPHARFQGIGIDIPSTIPLASGGFMSTSPSIVSY